MLFGFIFMSFYSTLRLYVLFKLGPEAIRPPEQATDPAADGA